MSRKIVKIILRGILWIFIGVIVLVVLVPILLYVPFVQDFAVKVATTEVKKSTGMKMEIGKLRLGFPLQLNVENAVIIQANGDTMLTAGKIGVDVKLMPLLKGEINVAGADLDSAFYQMGNSDSLMWIRAHVHYADIDDSDISLKNGTINLTKVEIDGANIRLRMLEDTTAVTPSDTANSTPWKIHADLIQLKNLNYSMNMESLIDSLGCQIPLAELRDGNVDMASRKIYGQSLHIDSVSATYLYPKVIKSDTIATATATATTSSSEMWTINADTLRLTAKEALYAESGHSPLAGFDPSYIQGNDIVIEVDSFYNRGTSINVPVKKISAIERCGLQLYADGTFSMNEKSMKAQDFTIETLKSNLKFSAEMGLGNLMTDTNLSLMLKGNGRIEPDEVAMAFPDMKQMLAPMNPVSLSADIEGTSGSLDIKEVNLMVPDMVRLYAEGVVDNPFTTDKIGGEITMNGSLSTITDKQFSFLPIKVVPSLKLDGNIAYHPGIADGKFTVVTRGGRLAASGKWNDMIEGYNATINLDRFPVDAFMPELGVGEITATITADGRGYNPMSRKSYADADIDLKNVMYQKVAYNDIKLKASLHDGNAIGTLTSYNTDFDGTVQFDANIDNDTIDWNIDGNIRNVNLQAMNFADTINEGKVILTSRGSYNMKTNDINAKADVTNLYWRMPDVSINCTDSISMTLISSENDMTAVLTNGDMRLETGSPNSLFSIISALPVGMKEIKAQTDSMHINVEALSKSFPRLDMVLEMGTNNVASKFLKESSDIGFKHLLLSMRNDSLISMNADVTGFNMGSTRLDSISLYAIQHGAYLVYRAEVNNRPGTFDDFAHVNLNGFLGNNRIAAYMKQENIENKKGFNLGLSAILVDSTITVKLVPHKPTIAYKKWTVNNDNFISYNIPTKHIDANLALVGDESYLKIFTEHPHLYSDTIAHSHEEFLNQEDLVVQISQVHLQDWLAINPFAPPVKGDVSADMRIRYENNVLTAKGDVELSDLFYGKERVGTFGLDVDVANSRGGKLMADITLMVDSIKTITAKGVLNDSTAANPFLLDFTMIKFPLKIVNPFIPEGMAKLSGTLNGQMDITGEMTNPIFNGFLDFDSTDINVKMLGATFKFSEEKIPVDSNVVTFSDFQIQGCNENPLFINGQVDVHNLANVMLDLTLKAKDIQVVNSDRARGGADIFGKAFLDLDAAVKGNMDFMRVNADVNILAGTNVTYVMAETTQSLTSRSNNDMVHFVNFNDSAQVESSDSITHSAMALNLEAQLQIEEGTTINVYLNTNGTNRAQVQPSGNLTYTMSALNGDRVTGRLNINDGFVRYTPPFMSEKNFKFQEGSYVAFNGDMLNPLLNIHAVDEIKANVTQSGQDSRLVNFDVSVSITNTLDNMNVAFDLSTNDDITVENELTSMSPEQRANQAMNMLLYKVYTGADTKASGNMSGNPLYSFLTSQLNSWAANNIRGVDISFGINQYDKTLDGSTSTATSYSYQVTKTLFNDRFKIVVGGNYSTDANSDENFSQNLINDISFEYMLNRSGSMYIRIFRHTGYESILEGEITQTGVGFVLKRKLNSLWELFGVRRD